MAELASAVLNFIASGLSTWHRIDTVINSIKDAPRNVEHWRVVGCVLKESLSQMEERIRHRQDYLTAPEQNLCRAIDRFTKDFLSDLEELERTIPKRKGGRFWVELRLKLQEDRDLITRLSRNCQIFQLTASALSLLDHSLTDTSGNRVHQFLEGFSDDNPEQLNSDEAPDLHKWREALYEVADIAAQHEFPDPSPHEHTPNDNQTPRRPSGVSPIELQYRFEAAVSRAKRMFEAKLPIMAKKAHDEAIQYGGEMQAIDANAIGISELVDMEITYVRIIKACVPFVDSYEALAWERLQNLKSNLLKHTGSGVNLEFFSEQEKVGILCADLRDREGAVEFLRMSLDAYLSNCNECADRIPRISMLVCEQYECMGQWNNLDAFKKVIFDKLGYDPASEPNALANTIRWCRQHGYEAAEVQGRLYIPEESYIDRTPLHDAAADTTIELEIVQQLIPIVYHARPDANGDTPLLIAVQHSNNLALQALLRITGSVHVWDSKGSTPLHRCDNDETLKLLLDEIKKPVHHSSPDERGFNLVHIDSTDGYGETVLHKACEKGNERMVRLLVAEGADVNLVSGSNETPLMITCVPCELKGKGRLSKERQRIVEMLVNCNADTKYRGDWGKPAVPKSLKARGYSDSEIDKMLSPDLTRRFTRRRQERFSVSTMSSSERPSFALSGVSSASPVELVGDTPTRPIELPITPVSTHTPPTLQSGGTWSQLQLAELPGSTPVVAVELDSRTVEETNQKFLKDGRMKSIRKKLKILGNK
ncbi:E3 ubiquitin-protein ligase HACE1 [Fusarium austroafricanum]|uniref:E3 ubiquitin-protein ligase HACE1 n=1 Tax=Fusarium austroafricanum TaxID=2364996 RepID=A0A8H4NZA7_9HYPO|nr:E3 ubiquitin-protein ligase HACE1 [Fusarium austroafricanum]